MPSTYSDLKIQLMATGENATTWGTVTNTNLGTAIEEAIVGTGTVSFASANVTLTLTNTNGTQTARNVRLVCTGTTGGARDLIVPNIEKPYMIVNTCADTITVKNSTGAGTAVPAGKSMWVYSTGAGVTEVSSYAASLALGTALPLSSGGLGATTAAGGRTTLELGTMATQAANAVAITGGSISGLSSALAVASGGTGSANAAGARSNLDAQQTLTSGTNIKTVNGSTLLGAGNIDTTGGNIPTGTKMLFVQTAAPTGWTKDVVHDNKALRVVSGSASTGGSVAFTSAFTSQAVAGTNSSTATGGTVGDTALTTAQMPSHTHLVAVNGNYTGAVTASNSIATTSTSGGDSEYSLDSAVSATVPPVALTPDVGLTSPTGSGDAHGHSFTGSSHTHTFTGTAINLAVQYVDVIICTKS